MTKTVEIILFCIAFLAQVMLISWFYVRRVVRERRYVLRNFPPTTHPKLYSQPIEYYEHRLRHIERVNLVIAAVGVLILAVILGALFGAWDGGLLGPSRDRDWTQFLVVPFFVVQMIFATVYVELATFKHQKAMALAPPPRVRTSELHRRRLTDFVSPAMLVAAALANIAFIVFVLDYRRHGFPWFTAAGNIIGVGFLVLAFAGSAAFALYARKPDPYQAHGDRVAFRKRVVQGTLSICIVVPVLIMISLVIKTFAADVLAPFIATLYCMACAVVTLWPRWRADRVDFDVYKADARDSTTGASATVRS